MDVKSGSTLGYSSASSDKLIYILEFVAHQSTPMRLQEIAAALAMSQSTVLRYLNSLINLGYISKDEDTLRYLPTFKICRLSHQILTHISIRDIASPFMRTMSQRFECGATISKRQGDELLYLDVIYHPNAPYGTIQRIGKNAPMHVTGSGKIFLSDSTDEGIDKYVNTKGLTPLTSKTITDIPTFLNELNCIRSLGYAVDDEECEDGIRCVSAPLYDYTDKIVAAISVFAKVETFTLNDVRNVIAPQLLETSSIISARLGYIGRLK